MFKVVGVTPTVACRWESGTLVLPYSVHILPVLENFMHVVMVTLQRAQFLNYHLLRPSNGGCLNIQCNERHLARLQHTL